MLVRLLPDDISKQWGSLSETISRALPPFTKHTKDRMQIILKSLLSGVMQCWIMTEYDKDNDQTIVYAVMTTEMAIDAASLTKNLSIFSLYSLQQMPKDIMEDAYDTLKIYAKSLGCTYILGFTDNPKVIQLVNYIGGDTKTTLIKLEV